MSLCWLTFICGKHVSRNTRFSLGSDFTIIWVICCLEKWWSESAWWYLSEYYATFRVYGWLAYYYPLDGVWCVGEIAICICLPGAWVQVWMATKRGEQWGTKELSQASEGESNKVREDILLHYPSTITPCYCVALFPRAVRSPFAISFLSLSPLWQIIQYLMPQRSHFIDFVSHVAPFHMPASQPHDQSPNFLHWYGYARVWGKKSSAAAVQKSHCCSTHA